MSLMIEDAVLLSNVYLRFSFKAAGFLKIKDTEPKFQNEQRLKEKRR